MINQPIRLMILILIFLLSGCQSEPPASTEQAATPAVEVQPTSTALSVQSSPLSSPVSPIPQPTPTIAKPAKGKAAIRGAIISTTTQRPVGDTLIYLTAGLGEKKDLFPPLLAGPQEKDIQGYTDKQGWFTVNNVPPGNYYLIIWAPLSWTPLNHAQGANAGQPILLKLQPDQTLDLGEMTVIWP